jgi:alcohol dehydrogenase (cytochrome c)
MRKVVLGAIMAMALPFAANAQSADELAKGSKDTHNVVNYGMGYDLQRHSTLTQIDKKNVKNLVPVWNYSLDDNRSEESQPIIYKGVLYITTHAATMAIDAKTGRQLWKTKVEYPPETPRETCCGIINRGAAIYDGKIFRTTLDAHVVALDAKTGKELWNKTAIDFHDGYSMTVAPLVADGVVITGISGAEFGTRDFLDGWNPDNGEHLWRTYTVPAPGEPGGDTWPGDTYLHGGGSTWITGSFDPESHTVYWGIGNPGSFNAALRKGDNLYTDSVLAINPKDGKIKWHYQFSPNDPFDYDSVAEMVLATIHGKKVLIDANRNGFLYVIDRETGKPIAAHAYIDKINWAKGIDLKSGRPIETELVAKAKAGEKVELWPSLLGGKNWEPISYDPKKEIAYINTLNIGFNYKSAPAEYKAGQFYWGIDLTLGFAWAKNPDGSDAPRGYLKAVDPMTGKIKWSVPSALPRFSGVLSTAGGLVFVGQLDGRFEAFDADTGKELWHFQTGSGIEGQPVTWEEDGVQYIAVTSGIGGVYALYSGDPRLASVPAGGSLWAFALKGK